MRESPWLDHYDSGVPAHLDVPSVPAFHFLDAAARRDADRTCTIYGEARISYGAMSALTGRLAAALIASGLQRGERVGLLLPNLPQFVLAYYAVLKAGGIVVAINPMYRPREIVAQANDAGISRLFVLEEAYATARVYLPETGIRRLIVTAPHDLDDPTARTAAGPRLEAGDIRLLDLLASVPPAGEADLPVIAPDDVAIFQYTGGTTGTPKGAIGLHRNLVANTLQVRAWLSEPAFGSETVLMAIPLFHVYGMVLGMSLATAIGAPMVMVPNPRDVGGLLAAVQRHRPTLFPGVPTLFNAINYYPEAAAYDLKSIRVAISGSAPLMQDTKDRFEALTHGRVCEGYGLSEAPTATHCNPVRGENRSGSIGLPWPDVDCRIVSLEDGQTDLPPGEAGELLVKGPQVMRGYHNLPEETEAALRDGWLHTGDIARMDADGYFYIVDRKKELIKVGGFQVWPREVEEVIAMHSSVLEAGVAGIPDAFRGEVVKAWVVLKPGHEVDADEIREWCREYLAPYKVPVQVEFRSELPKTAVGKVLRRELARQEREKG